jgi:uncharacterized phage protein gp47/JayE
MSTEPLPIPVLDPRNEATLVESAIARVETASDGQLNDFSAHSPLRALLEGQAFAQAELLWYLNQLPTALALAYLKIAGVERNLGTTATARLQFSLTTALTTPYTIPAGFSVSDGAGELLYYTDAVLVIPPGSVSGSMTATAAELGPEYNLPAYAINSFQLPLAFLATVANLEAAGGGTNAETVEAAIARGLEAIRSRQVLITADDYQDKGAELIGVGARGYAIPLLGADKISEQLGAVHVFVLNADGSRPSTQQCSAAQAAMQQLSPLGTAVYCSPLEPTPVDVRAIARYTTGVNPTTVASGIWTALSNYLSPLNFRPGQSVLVKEVEYLIRAEAGIEYVQSVTLGGFATNQPMPLRYAVAAGRSLFLELVDAQGRVLPFGFGVGDPD